MNTVIATYSIYLAISIAVTVWVGQSLHKNGRLFLVRTFGGDEDLADSINHLLLVGFYLVNLGFVALFLRCGARPTDVANAFEALSTKQGIVLLVLGGMHYLNLYVFSRMRKRARLHEAPPPVAPDGMLSAIGD